MSSNIRVQKQCEYCKQEFEAKTIYTKYCSHTCNSRDYKKIQREKKLALAATKKQASVKSKLVPVFNYSEITDKELLTIKEASAYLNITHVTLRRWLKDNIITSTRIGKKHLIRKSALDSLLSVSK